jgi:hypothetical protein
MLAIAVRAVATVTSTHILLIAGRARWRLGQRDRSGQHRRYEHKS